MAKRGRKNTDRPSTEDRNGQKPKKGFWSYFFEPLPEDPDADDGFDEYFDEETPSEDTLRELLIDEPDEKLHYDDDEVEHITWEDGEPVVTSVPLAMGPFAQALPETPAPASSGYVPLQSSFSNESGASMEPTVLLPQEGEDDGVTVSLEADPPAAEPDAEPDMPELPTYTPLVSGVGQDVTVVPPIVPSVVSELPTYTPLVSGVGQDAAVAPPVAPPAVSELPTYTPLVSGVGQDAAVAPPVVPSVVSELPTYTPLVSGAGPDVTVAPPVVSPVVSELPTYTPLVSGVGQDVTVVPPIVPSVVSELPIYTPLVSGVGQDVTVAPPVSIFASDATAYMPAAPAGSEPSPADAVMPPAGEWYGYMRGAADAPPVTGAAEEDGTPIRLFDEEDGLSDTARQRGQTTRLFKTGTSATTRIHINETEEAVRREEAARRARARAAKQKQDAAAERRNKRNKRSAILKGLFANIAFVLFFIGAVLVALYYGFLLSDISVAGNVRYSSEKIIEASGLQLGTHMLFCNLDEAEARIEEDPYLQVDSIAYGFPNRIRIMVTERKEIAGISGLDYNVIIDDQGHVLSMSPGTDLSGLLQVSGISMTGFRLGQRLGEGNDFGTATLIDIIGKLEEYELIDNIASIDLTRPLAITMKANNGLTLHVGQGTDLDNKMSALSKLLPRFVEQSINAGTLFLSAKGGAVYSPPNAAANAQVSAAGDEQTASLTLPTDDPNFVDDDGDGLDDNTGAPRAAAITPGPGATPAPTPAPTAYVPGGGADDFSG